MLKLFFNLIIYINSSHDKSAKINYCKFDILELLGNLLYRKPIKGEGINFTVFHPGTFAMEPLRKRYRKKIVLLVLSSSFTKI